MSADNGVYILKTNKQYRVKHLQAIDNLYWDYCKTQSQNTIVPTRVFEMFGDCKYTYDHEKAFTIANNIFKKLPICEYGIQLIDINMSWGMVLKKARIHINKEIQQCKNDSKFTDEFDDLISLKQKLDNTWINKKENRKQTLYTVQDAIQEFEDEAFHHFLKSEISVKAKCLALKALYSVRNDDSFAINN